MSRQPPALSQHAHVALAFCVMYSPAQPGVVEAEVKEKLVASVSPGAGSHVASCALAHSVPMSPMPSAPWKAARGQMYFVP